MSLAQGNESREANDKGSMDKDHAVAGYERPSGIASMSLPEGVH